MKIITLVTAFAVAILAAPVKAQSSTSCTAFRAEIENQEKDLAAIQVDGLSDNSAPRATLRQQKRTNALTRIAISVDLMAQNKCPPLSAPIDELAYITDALACETALLERKSDDPACKRADWKRSAK